MKSKFLSILFFLALISLPIHAMEVAEKKYDDEATEALNKHVANLEGDLKHFNIGLLGDFRDQLRPNVKEIKSFIERKADPNHCGAIQLAILFGELELFRMLLPHMKMDVLKKNNTLHLAASKTSEDEAHLEIVKDLIDLGFDVNARERDGQTPLHASATQGSKSTCILLLSYGADPNLVTHKNHRADDYAKMEHEYSTQELLLKYKEANSDKEQQKILNEYSCNSQKLKSLMRTNI